jgi:preprotein translocase subunit YajC
MGNESEVEGLGVALMMGLALIVVSSFWLYEVSRRQHEAQQKIEKVLNEAPEKEKQSKLPD